jgi:uncharacterized protein
MALQFVRESPSDFAITAFDGKAVSVGAFEYRESIAVSFNTRASAWHAAHPVTPEMISRGTALDAEIMIIGTGAKHVFLRHDVLRPLIDARIGFELMDSAAACRTYNVLLAEGRKVGLLLLIESK